MPTPEIIERVRKVHAELGETQPTPMTRAEIEVLRQHVELVVKQPDHKAHYTSLKDRIELAATGFQLDHPKLFGLLNGLAVELAAAGL
jgi:hypothetical protein